MHILNSFTLLIFEHTRIQTLFWILLFFWFLNTFELKRCEFFHSSDLWKHFCVLKLQNIWPINNGENKCLYSLCFWIPKLRYWPSCVKRYLDAYLGWKIINDYGTGKPSRQVYGESFKREQCGWTCSLWYFKVLYLRNFVWGDYKMWDYREKSKQTWNGLEVPRKHIVKGPFHTILNVEKIIKDYLSRTTKWK